MGKKKKQKLGLEEKELKLQTHQNFNTSKNLSSQEALHQHLHAPFLPWLWCIVPGRSRLR